jgi:hypothetical protein
MKGDGGETFSARVSQLAYFFLTCLILKVAGQGFWSRTGSKIQGESMVDATSRDVT